MRGVEETILYELEKIGAAVICSQLELSPRNTTLRDASSLGRSGTRTCQNTTLLQRKDASLHTSTGAARLEAKSYSFVFEVVLVLNSISSSAGITLQPTKIKEQELPQVALHC